MSNHIETGNIGEQLAKEYLIEKGYKILETNWRFSKAEVDIIAKDKDMLVFIEVKTRSYDYYGAPESFVTEKKEALLFDAANRYMELIQHDWEIRFDVIGIIMKDIGNYQLKHTEDAFYPR